MSKDMLACTGKIDG